MNDLSAAKVKTVKTVAFVTDSDHPTVTDDDALAALILAAANVRVMAILWDDPLVDWRAFDLIVVRTTWDYSRRYRAFMHWLDRLEALHVPVWNSVAVMRWNADKNYLRELEARGLATVPTAYYPRGATVDLAAEVAKRGWTEVVIKPTISAGSHRTWRISTPITALDQARLDEILADADVMLQPFLDMILTEGEWSLIFFDRVFSHALIKRAKTGDFRIQPQFGGTTEAIPEPPAALLSEAARILDQVAEPLLYARVDGVLIGGQFHLMELELIEPRLFMNTNPDAPARFAEAIRRKLIGD